MLASAMRWIRGDPLACPHPLLEQVGEPPLQLEVVLDRDLPADLGWNRTTAPCSASNSGKQTAFDGQAGDT